MQHFPGRLLVALGLSVLALEAPISKEVVVYNQPQAYVQASSSEACLRTVNTITLMPGEYFIMHDDLDGIFTDVAKYKLISLSPGSNKTFATFRFEDTRLSNPQHIVLPDSNGFRLKGKTPQGWEKVYRVQGLGIYPDSATMAFGPESCFPDQQRETSI